MLRKEARIEGIHRSQVQFSTLLDGDILAPTLEAPLEHVTDSLLSPLTPSGLAARRGSFEPEPGQF